MSKTKPTLAEQIRAARPPNPETTMLTMTRIFRGIFYLMAGVGSIVLVAAIPMLFIENSMGHDLWLNGAVLYLFARMALGDTEKLCRPYEDTNEN